MSATRYDIGFGRFKGPDFARLPSPVLEAPTAGGVEVNAVFVPGASRCTYGTSAVLPSPAQRHPGDQHVAFFDGQYHEYVAVGELAGYFADSFDRGDSTYVNTGVTAWVQSPQGVDDAWYIISNTARGRGEARTLGHPFGPYTHLYVETQLNSTTNNTPGIFAKSTQAGGDTAGYFAQLRPANGETYLKRNGVIVASTPAAAAVSLPAKLGLEVNGATVRFFVNGFEKLSYTDPNPAGVSGSYVGIGTGRVAGEAFFDYFTAQELGKQIEWKAVGGATASGVLGSLSDAVPLPLGTAVSGIDKLGSRADHVHSSAIGGSPILTQATGDARYLQLAGGTLSGRLTLSAGLTSVSESHFHTGTYTDPQVGVARAIKVGGSGVAVLGGIRTDTLLSLGATDIEGIFTAHSTSHLKGLANFGPLDGVNAGGTVRLVGAGTNPSWDIKNNAGLLRFTRVSDDAELFKLSPGTAATDGVIVQGARFFVRKADGTDFFIADPINDQITYPEGTLSGAALKDGSVTSLKLSLPGQWLAALANAASLKEVQVLAPGPSGYAISPATFVAGEIVTDDIWLGVAGKLWVGAARVAGALPSSRLEFNGGGTDPSRGIFAYAAGTQTVRLSADGVFQLRGTGANYLNLESSRLELWKGAARTVFLDGATGDAVFEGQVTATSGSIGGFTVSTLEGLYAGAGATRVQMKPGAGFWAGADLRDSAPFRVTEAGALTATSGEIGGFSLATDRLRTQVATANEVGLSGAPADGIATHAGTDIAFWAGGPRNSSATGAPFRITKDGTLVATKGSFAGNLTGTAMTLSGNLTVSGKIRTTDAGVRVQLNGATNSLEIVQDDGTRHGYFGPGEGTEAGIKIGDATANGWIKVKNQSVYLNGNQVQSNGFEILTGSNHSHGVVPAASGVVPDFIDVNQAGAVGTSAEYARADHVHGSPGNWPPTSHGHFASGISAGTFGTGDFTFTGKVIVGNAPILGKGSTGNTLAIDSGAGIVRIGADTANVSSCHYVTNMSEHWFNVKLNVNGNIINTSDARLKKDITDLGPMLSKMRKVKAKQFRLNTDAATAPKSAGFLADELVGIAEGVAVNSIAPIDGDADNGERVAVKAYSINGMLAVLWQAVQELADEVDRLKPTLPVA